MNKYKELARRKRGQTTIEDDNNYTHLSNTELIKLIADLDPQKRTSAAKILGKRKCIEAIAPLCNQLRVETVLYPKIAISKALGNMGEAALPELIQLIGKIGNNQNKELPSKLFAKKNYPCPRDIVVRTIVKTGKIALKYLTSILESKDTAIVSEVIDAIGYISFYSGDHSSFPMLLNLLNATDSDIIKWKVLRAFSAFPLKESGDALKYYLTKSNIPALRREAERSLAQVDTKRPLLSKCLSVKDFHSFYWLKEELLGFCRENGLSAIGSKKDLESRIETFLLTGSVPKKPSRVCIPKIKEQIPKEFRRETIIGHGWRCSQYLRAFFEEEIGHHFRFDGIMRDFIKYGTGKTLQDAIEAWEAGQKGPKAEKEIASQFEYNRHIREFFKEHRGATLREAIEAWKKKKATRR